MLRILSKLRRKPDRTYSVKAIYHVDTAEMDAALAKAEELNSAIKLYYPAFSAPDIADIYLRLPYASKLFFSAFSVGRIVPITIIICTIVRIPPAIPTVSGPFPNTKVITTAESGKSRSPQMNQSLPIYA